MAVARKCDRCGKLYEHYMGKKLDKSDINGFIPILRYSNGNYSESHSKDFCPECCGEFIKWLKGN